MGEMLGQIARFHDDEMSRFVDWFTRAFEPVLMAVLGIAIGLVVVLMYMPIFELAGSIQ
jgi:general secretion pathway protein F